MDIQIRAALEEALKLSKEYRLRFFQIMRKELKEE